MLEITRSYAGLIVGICICRHRISGIQATYRCWIVPSLAQTAVYQALSPQVLATGGPTSGPACLLFCTSWWYNLWRRGGVWRPPAPVPNALRLPLVWCGVADCQRSCAALLAHASASAQCPALCRARAASSATSAFVLRLPAATTATPRPSFTSTHGFTKYIVRWGQGRGRMLQGSRRNLRLSVIASRAAASKAVHLQICKCADWRCIKRAH